MLWALLETCSATGGVAVTDIVVIGIGSNQGDSARIVRAAVGELRPLAGGAAEDFRVSSLWRTSPVDCPPDAPAFVNAAVAFPAPPEQTPEGMLAGLKALERRWGRLRSEVRNAPRILDLDLLIYGCARRDADDFVLPHPRGLGRRFVLAPAAEVAPELPWPGTGKTVAELEAALRSDEVVERIGAAPSAARPGRRTR